MKSAMFAAVMAGMLATGTMARADDAASSSASGMRSEAAEAWQHADDLRHWADAYRRINAGFVYKNRLIEQALYDANRLDRKALALYDAADALGGARVTVVREQPVPPKAAKYARAAERLRRMQGGYVDRNQLVPKYEALARKHAGIVQPRPVIPASTYASKPIERFLEHVR